MIKLDTLSIYCMVNPQKGLIVYNTSCNQIWSYNGHKWENAIDHLGFLYDIDSFTTLSVSM